jgi:hypothetical protein
MKLLRCLDWGFRDFPQYQLATVGIIPRSVSQPSSSKFLYVHGAYVPISFVSTQKNQLNSVVKCIKNEWRMKKSLEVLMRIVLNTQNMQRCDMIHESLLYFIVFRNTLVSFAVRLYCISFCNTIAMMRSRIMVTQRADRILHALVCRWWKFC